MISRRTGFAVTLLAGGILAGVPSTVATAGWSGVRHSDIAIILTDTAALLNAAPILPISGAPVAPMHGFLVSVVTDVHRFWATEWAAHGDPAPVVAYRFPARGERVPIAVECTADGSGLSDDATAQYCWIDDGIVISQEFAQRIGEGTVAANDDVDDVHATGDFSVAYVVAHEYAHNLQTELGLIGTSSGGSSRLPSVRHEELHADCWSGVWARSAHGRGVLGTGDIREATQTTMDLGDYDVWAPDHHGTPGQRTAAFRAGYSGGTSAACDDYLHR